MGLIDNMKIIRILSMFRQERKTTMSLTRKLFWSAVLMFLLWLGDSAPRAQSSDQTCPYTLASLRGSYATVATYGANLAMLLQAEKFDGAGNLTRTGILNQPAVGSADGARTISSVTSTGTYTVNCNGTGTIVRDVTQNGVVVGKAYDNFIVTAAEKGWPFLATTIVDAQNEPSLIVSGGVFVTRVHTRLPDPVPATRYWEGAAQENPGKR